MNQPEAWVWDRRNEDDATNVRCYGGRFFEIVGADPRVVRMRDRRERAGSSERPADASDGHGGARARPSGGEAMTDREPASLFDPEPMSEELAGEFDTARRELLDIARDVDAFLEQFFPETWIECHRVHQVTHRGKVLEVPGTPDFNGFDRAVGRYGKALAKIRSKLWEIKNAADNATKEGPR